MTTSAQDTLSAVGRSAASHAHSTRVARIFNVFFCVPPVHQVATSRTRLFGAQASGSSSRGQ